MADESKTEVGDTYAVSLDSIKAAAKRISGHVKRTPVMTSTRVNEKAGTSLFFKCECFQKTGSFKARGATNAVLSLPDEVAARSIIAHSSGNHAQGVAFAASTRNLKAHVVMPDDAPGIKVRAVQGYGAQVTQVPSSKRAETVARIVEETGMYEIHASNDPYVISGQGTMALELLEQVADMSPPAEGQPVVDAVVVPVGGGGMISGVAVAVKSLDPRIKVFGAEPAACDDAARSKATEGNPDPFVTVADGLCTTLGNNTWPIVRDLVDRIFVVSEEEIVTGMRLVWEKMKLCVEPSAGTGVAVVTSDRFKKFASEHGVKRIAVILCGGNVDLSKLPFGASRISSDSNSSPLKRPGAANFTERMAGVKGKNGGQVLP